MSDICHVISAFMYCLNLTSTKRSLSAALQSPVISSKDHFHGTTGFFSTLEKLSYPSLVANCTAAHSAAPFTDEI